MSRNMQQFGSVTLARARSSADLKLLLKDSLLKTDTIIIKPNWVGVDLGLYTDCETLRMLLEAIDSRIVVTEAYQLHRSTDSQRGGIKFTVDSKERNLRWLLRGGWGWVQKNPSWDWFKEKGLWDFIRKLDNWLLDNTALPTSSTNSGSNTLTLQKKYGKDGQQTPRKSKRQ